MGFFRRFFPGRATPRLHVTLWPTFDHWRRFASDARVAGVRLNSAMISAAELDSDFATQVVSGSTGDRLWFDIKAMQLRVREIVCGDDCDHLEFVLNRPIACRTPCPVWFKGGEDCAELAEIRGG